MGQSDCLLCSIVSAIFLEELKLAEDHSSSQSPSYNWKWVVCNAYIRHINALYYLITLEYSGNNILKQAVTPVIFVSFSSVSYNIADLMLSRATELHKV
jgi:hypothetical protein